MRKRMVKKCLKCDVRTNKDIKSPRFGTNHHILPIRWFKGEGRTIHLCQKCHLEIEYLYLKAETENGKSRKKLLPLQYKLIADDFCGKGKVI